MACQRYGSLLALFHLLQIIFGDAHFHGNVLAAGYGQKLAALGGRAACDCRHLRYHAGKICFDAIFTLLDIVLGHRCFQGAQVILGCQLAPGRAGELGRVGGILDALLLGFAGFQLGFIFLGVL